MSELLSINGEWRDGVPLIDVDYAPSQMFQPKTSKLLSEKLVEQYRLLRAESKDDEPSACVLWIKATTAGSPLVRAIFELYKVLHADGTIMFCAGYPVAYMESLTSLGLPALPGFKLTTTVDDALKRSEGT